MTREDVIRMAREAGVFFSVPDVCPAEPLEHHVKAVERFADLVAAHEREECAKVCEEQETKYWWTRVDGAAAIRARR